ncbi:MAG: DNA-3-methyladenine glycosylase [Alphaproteobacteria bacterium]|nr:DNA-3-methyladenine glycosylase [Alphaproteobacteria bacterium]
MSRDPLPRTFYERDTLEVARDLLGRWLVAGDVVLRVSEVEAYRGPSDSACHTAAGRTARNEAMWGPVGHAYVYRCYGLHWMLNVVSGEEGSGCAVLVRGAEIVEGSAIVATRRGRSGRGTLAGPAKVAQALAIDRTFDHHDLTEAGGLSLAVGTPADRVLVGPRVGIDYALPEHRDAPWRLAIDGSTEVSVRRTLRSGTLPP